MPRKLTLEQFKEKSRLKHGDSYDYSESVYINSDTKVKIYCNKHREYFYQNPAKHMGGNGCPKCGDEKIGLKLSQGKDKFIEKAIKVWGEGKYDYSKVVYKNNSIPVKIIDIETGIEFEQRPSVHLKKILSNKFTGNEPYTNETFIIKSKEVWGEDMFDYSLLNYKNSNSKVTLIDCDGNIFEQLASSHLNGTKYIGICETKKLTNEEYINRCKEVHKDKDYDFSTINYVNMKNKIEVRCNKHGIFFTKPQAFYDGHGCMGCYRESLIENHPTRSNTEDFIRKAKLVHGDDFDYSLVDYKNNYTKVKLKCKNGHSFEQTPHSHLAGNRCHKCKWESGPEQKINDFLLENDIKFIRGDRKIIKPFELDFVLEEYKIAIEVNGIAWHSEKFGKDHTYHINKTKLSNKKGYRLIHIFEDEINNDFENIKEKLLNIIYNKETFTDKEIILDRRWYNYPPAGYVLKEETEPNYTYTKNNNRISESNHSNLDNGDEWFKIWDCGKIICSKS